MTGITWCAGSPVLTLQAPWMWAAGRSHGSFPAGAAVDKLPCTSSSGSRLATLPRCALQVSTICAGGPAQCLQQS